MTNIRKSVQAYEEWMGKQLGREMVAKDIALKHEKMRESPFVNTSGVTRRAGDATLPRSMVSE